jgi:all-trans-8'-apo-beta-carotenal 15,15'-oxygenase
MNRRQLLQASTAALAAPWAPHALSDTRANTPEAFKTAFAQAVARRPELAPYHGVSADLHCEALTLEGRWPAGLRGRFYRNGPALFERGAQRYQHWFAGDGMVQQFTIADGKVSHRGRFVRTSKFVREEVAGEFMVGAFGTTLPTKVSISGPDVMNTANTHVMEHGGKLLALWEGGSAYAMNPATLDTVGPVTWQDGWAQMPFSAHPKVDAQGHLWNIGGVASMGGLAVYHVAPNGQLAKAQMVKLPLDAKRTGGMVHDVAVTDRHIVVPIPPVVVRWDRILRGEIGRQTMALTPGEPLRIWVAPKDALDAGRLFELPPEMVFHVGNAHEVGDELLLSYVGNPGNDFLGGAGVELMRGGTPSVETSLLRVVRLNLRTGAVRQDTLVADSSTEFPRVDPRFVGTAARQLVMAAAWRQQGRAEQFSFSGVQVVNTDTGAVQRFDYGADFMPEEHIVVPRPSGSQELDGWLLATAYHLPSRRHCVSCFDARRVADGPIARAWLPYGLPMGFHGSFTAT